MEGMNVPGATLETGDLEISCLRSYLKFGIQSRVSVPSGYRQENDDIHEILICVTNESDRHTSLTRTTSPTNPVNVRLDRV